MTAISLCQTIVRNGKTFWFFPDVTIDEFTKGFLVDSESPAVSQFQTLWYDYCNVPRMTYFSVYVNMQIEDGQVREYLYSMYQSIPVSQVDVVGMAVPKQSVIVKKRRITSL